MHHPKWCSNSLISSEFHDFGAHAVTDEAENIPQLANITKINVYSITR